MQRTDKEAGKAEKRAGTEVKNSPFNCVWLRTGPPFWKGAFQGRDDADCRFFAKENRSGRISFGRFQRYRFGGAENTRADRRADESMGAFFSKRGIVRIR